MTTPARRVFVFAREPVAGRVKTRLAREIGASAATALYGAFLQDLAAALPDPERWESVLAHAEPEAGPFLRKTFPSPWTLVPQGEGSLGERLKNFLEGVGKGASVLVAGSDAPTLGRSDLESAFRAIEEGAEVVFAPSPDGGFSLVGVAGGGERARVRKTGESPGDFLEGVRWSTACALEDARRAAERLGRRVALLTPLPDVDELADLVALSPSLTHSKNPNSSVATRRAIEAHARRGAA